MKKNKVCPEGKILRKGYTTKKGTKVAPKCIKDQGKPGKGPKTLPKIKELNLGEFGYELKYSFEKRKIAIKKATKKYDLLKILRYLVLIRNYSISNKKNYDKYTKDIEFIKVLRNKN